MWTMFLLATAFAPDVRPVAPATRQTIRNHFGTELVDGPSARWLWPPMRGDGSIYCGWINAKNRMGGYNGWHPYRVRFDGGKVTESLLLTTSHELALKLLGDDCIKAGYDLFNPPKN